VNCMRKTNIAKENNADTIFEAVIRSAAKEVMNAEARALPAAAALGDFAPSDRLAARINGLAQKIARENNRESLARRMVRNAASFAMIFIIGCASVFMAAMPVQGAVLEIVTGADVDIDAGVYAKDFVPDLNIPPEPDEDQRAKDNKPKKLNFKYRTLNKSNNF